MLFEEIISTKNPEILKEGKRTLITSDKHWNACQAQYDHRKPGARPRIYILIPGIRVSLRKCVVVSRWSSLPYYKILKSCVSIIWLLLRCCFDTIFSQLYSVSLLLMLVIISKRIWSTYFRAGYCHLTEHF